MSGNNYLNPGESPGMQNIDPQQLDPQLLFNQYLDAASEMPAGNRAEHLTDFAISLRDANPDAYEHVITIAKDALREAWANPESAETLGGPLGIASYMAEATLDEELIPQADEQQRDGLYVKLAVKRQDPTIVPDNQESQDDYLRGVAVNYGAAESIHEIVDPTTRALAYKEVFAALDIDAFGPGEWLALEEEAWRAIITMPVDKHGHHRDTIATFAVDHGAAFIERITDTELRHQALRTFAQKVGTGDEHTFDREWLKQRLAHELYDIDPEYAAGPQTIMDSIAWAAHYFADPEFADSILPDILTEAKPTVMADARRQKALRDLDARAALALPLDNREFKGRDHVLSHVASETVDLNLAEKIPDEFYRMLACSVIAGKTQDPMLKEEVISYVLEGLEPEEHDHTENWGVALFVTNLNDPEISRRLLTTPNITSATIISVARTTNDIGLALAIPDALLRASVLSEIAGKLLRPDLLDIDGVDVNPTMRANALRTIHQAVTGARSVE